MTQTRKVTRSELYRLVWSEPLTALSARFGISDVGLRKACIRHDIPLPPQGYRQRATAGRAPKPSPLPHRRGDEVIEFPAAPEPPPVATGLMESVFAPLIDAEARPENHVGVAADAVPTHPVAKRIVKALKAARADKYGAVLHECADAFRVRVPPGSIDRVGRLIDALATALDARGLEIRTGGTDPAGAGIVVGGELERLAIEETSHRTIHRATEAEKAATRRLGYATAPLYDFVPSGVLTVQISTATYRDGVRSLWRDGKTCKVEDCLNEILAGLYRSAHAAAVQRRQLEVRAQRAEDENARRAALREQRAAARKELQDLEGRSLAWERAQRMRAFIAAYRNSCREADGDVAPEVADWVERASRHADRIDPLTPTPRSALDYDEADLAPVSLWQVDDD